jgi:predicted phage gp36 major capsid-like protein
VLGEGMNRCRDKEAIDAIAGKLAKDVNFLDRAQDAFAYAMVGKDRLLQRDLCNMAQPSRTWASKAEGLGMSGELNGYLQTHPIYPAKISEK